MANIKRIDGKTGTAYKITVTRGRDSAGKLYKALPDMRQDGTKAVSRVDLSAKLKAAGMTREAVSKAAGVSPTTVTLACRGGTIMAAKAEAIAGALGQPVKELFTITKDGKPLSN